MSCFTQKSVLNPSSKAGPVCIVHEKTEIFSSYKVREILNILLTTDMSLKAEF